MSPCWNDRRAPSTTSSRLRLLPAYVRASSTWTCASGQRAIAMRTNAEPMKPAPPVTRIRAERRASAILAAPVVGNVVVVRVDPVLVGLRVVVRVRRRVDQHAAHRLHALH